ncbi:MAG TPA: hypothetical protein PK168_02490 [Candidatus Paceibacterota bacterium]|nr:hypothetical protein [Candidatus Paceibacterota bacterium]
MKNKDENIDTLLNEEIKNLLSEYLDEKSICYLNCLLKESEYQRFFYDFMFWFKDTDFLKISQEDSQLLVSQKISIKLVILIAFIHSLSKDYREEAVQKFFENLELHEKFLLCLIVEEENLMSEEDATGITKNSKKYKEYWAKEQKRQQENKRKLVESFIGEDEKEIDALFKERIKYLFALRSQIVHRGSSVFISRINSPRKHFLKSAIVEEYPSKQIGNKILYFRDCNEPFEIILEELFWAAFFRKKELSMKKLSLRIKNNLEYILNYFLKNESDIISLEQKNRIEEILKNS